MWKKIQRLLDRIRYRNVTWQWKLDYEDLTNQVWIARVEVPCRWGLWRRLLDGMLAFNDEEFLGWPVNTVQVYQHEFQFEGETARHAVRLRVWKDTRARDRLIIDADSKQSTRYHVYGEADFLDVLPGRHERIKDDDDNRPTNTGSDRSEQAPPPRKGCKRCRELSKHRFPVRKRKP